MGLKDILGCESADRKARRDRDRAESLFQLKEHGGGLWLTYDGWLVCPCEMLRDDAVEAVMRMRELYVQREVK